MNCPACEATRDQASHLRKLLEADRARVKSADRVVAVARQVVDGKAFAGELEEALKAFDGELERDAVRMPDHS